MEICIAHGGDLSQPSGGTDRIVTFAEGLQNNGFDVTVIAPRPTNSFPPELSDVEVTTVPVKVRGIASQPIRAAFVARKARQIVRDRRAYLQLEHSTLAGVASLLGNSEFILDMHDLAFPSPQYRNLPFSKPIQRTIYRLEKRGAEKSAHVIVVSSPIKRVLMEEWGIPEQQISVIPNGFPEEKLKGFLGIEEVNGRVGFIGTLHSKLDLHTFIEIAQLPQVESVNVIGDGEAREKLEHLAKNEDIGNLNLTGRLPHSDAYELLASCEVVVYPLYSSLHTKMLVSRKIFDYAALGKAMVLDDVSESTVWHRFKSNNAALFADPEDRNDFVDTVRRLIQNDELREEISKNAKEISADYTWEERTKELIGLYEELEVSNHGP